MIKVLEYASYLVLAAMVGGMLIFYVTQLNSDYVFKAKKISADMALAIDALVNFPVDGVVELSFEDGYTIRLLPKCDVQVFRGEKLLAEEKCLLYQFDKTYEINTPVVVIEKRGKEIRPKWK